MVARIFPWGGLEIFLVSGPSAGQLAAEPLTLSSAGIGLILYTKRRAGYELLPGLNYAAYPISRSTRTVHHQSGRIEAARLKVRSKMLGTLLIILLVLALVGAVPRWGYSRDWGYYPSGGLGLVLLIVLILVLMGRI
jgi:Protein of unknown function (DUF3309)